jgi:predicted aconitase
MREAFGGEVPEETVQLTPDMVRTARGWLSTARGDAVDAVAVGSPHLSYEEMIALGDLLAGRRVRLPFYAHTGRHVLKQLESAGRLSEIEAAGVAIVVDTCIVVTPILPGKSGVLLTNSGKFANYAPGNTGWSVLYGSLAECVETAVRGRLVRDEALWA